MLLVIGVTWFFETARISDLRIPKRISILCAVLSRLPKPKAYTFIKVYVSVAIKNIHVFDMECVTDFITVFLYSNSRKNVNGHMAMKIVFSLESREKNSINPDP